MTPTTARVSLRDRSEDDPFGGFRSHSDFISAVVSNSHRKSPGEISDERLRSRFAPNQAGANETAFLLPRGWTPRSLRAAAGSDEHGEYSGAYGTFLGDRQSIKSDAIFDHNEGDPTAGRTLPIRMEEPSLRILARTDLNHTTTLSGGLTVTRHPETVDISTSRGGIEAVDLDAQSMTGLAYGTEELISANPQAFYALVAGGFGLEFNSQMLREKIRGLGGDQYTGVLNSAAKVTVPKENNQAGDTIVADNVYNMAARCWGLNQAIWLANHDCRRQLYKLRDPDSNAPLYRSPVAEGLPAMLLEAPLFYTEHCSTLGDEGDICLVNWSQYLDALYQPARIDESVHVRFISAERAIRFWVRNAGAPWWRAPLTPAESTVTISPIVTLADRG